MSKNITIESVAVVVAEFAKVHFGYDKLLEAAKKAIQDLIASDKDNKSQLLSALRKELKEVHGLSKHKVSQLFLACGIRERKATEKKKIVIEESVIEQIKELALKLAEDHASVALRRAYTELLKEQAAE